MKSQDDTIIAKLDMIKSELDYIRENMVKKDEIMSGDEFEAYKRSFDKKNLVSSEDIRKELGL